jgi:CRISPR-associated exonuclease Cas4
MHRGNAHDGLGPCLVDCRDLMKKHEGELIFLVGDLDHIAVDRVKVLGDIDGDLVRTHGYTFTSAPIRLIEGRFRLTAARSISISSIVTGSICPLRLYYGQKNDKSIESPEYPRYTICKQISYHLGAPLDRDQIWDECCSIYPGINPALQAFLDECISFCELKSWRVSKDTDVMVSSKHFGMFGSIDRLFDTPPYFSLVRASKAPEAGIYRFDRLRILCYALCLEEHLGIPVTSGLVEYIPEGIQRSYTVQPRDRRALFPARKRALEIMSGMIPKKPLNPPCTRCTFSDRCQPGVRCLSDLMHDDATKNR